MRNLIILIFLLVAPSTAFSAIIYVPDDHAKIQDAILAAAKGDTVLVRPGVYVTPTFDDQISFLGKKIEVRSDGDGDPATRDLSPWNTIIDGNGFPAVVCFLAGEGPSTVLAGFTITNGVVPGWYGGGIYCYNASPTISDNTIYGNQAVSGGGMSNEYSNPTITNCSFIGNSATNHGGGLFNYASNPKITHCLFINNSAGSSGGGYYNNSGSSILEHCTFSDNSADIGGGYYIASDSSTLKHCTFSRNSAMAGGGFFSYSGSSTLELCSFSENSADIGGGYYNNNGSSILEQCAFEDNLASNVGGGLYNERYLTISRCTFNGNSAMTGGGMSLEAGSILTMNNSIFNGNSAPSCGGAIYLYEILYDQFITNCTFCNNSAYAGGALYKEDYLPDGNILLTNCILWGDSPNEIETYSYVPPKPTFSCIQGWYPGTGNIDQDPLLVDPLNGDYHLSPASPCIDAGNNGAPGLPTKDFEGDPRIAGKSGWLLPLGGPPPSKIVDMGVDEYCVLNKRHPNHSIN